MDELRSMVSPVLLKTQQNIDSIIGNITLPAAISYDRTLENTGVLVQANFTSVDDINHFVASLSDESVQQKIKHVMDLT